MLGRYDLNLSGLHIRFVYYAAHTSKMVAMAVAVNDRTDRTCAEGLIDQTKRGSCGFPGRQWIDQYPSVLSFDHRHIRHVETTYLPHVFGQGEQTMFTQ